MRGGQIPEVDFLQRYGHLRPGSYDITAPRYDSPILRALLTQPVTGDGNSVKDNPGGEFAFTVAEAGAIENALAGEAMPVNLACLLDFYGKTTRARERLKFEFTRNLSDALEYIARAGELLDLARETMADIHLRTVLKYRNPEESTAEALVGGIMAEVRRREQEREIFRRLQLPPVIAGEEDFYFIRTFHARPNFITAAHVVAPCAFANSPQELLAMDLAGRVLLIENADPGFDWIFTRRPAALITKYGGAASHMAIRCAELQLPAAIGIGERQFSELCHCFAVSLDCALGILTPATTSAPPA